MNYYQRHIGDYAKKAGKLTMLQHGAYTLLIDACYDREKFPTREEAIDWSWASTKEEIEAVDFVLSKFFRLENNVYYQDRIIEEIDACNIKNLVNKLVAIAREDKRQNKGKPTKISKQADDLKARIKNDPFAKSYAAWVEMVRDVDVAYTQRAHGVHDAPPTQYPIPNTHNPILKSSAKEDKYLDINNTSVAQEDF